MSRTSKTQRQTRREIPSWLESGSQQAVGLAQNIAGREYTPYTGQRIAQMTGNEQQASALARTGAGQYQSDLDKARTFAESAATPFPEVDMEGYINPYVKGALDPAAREVREEMARQQRMIGGAAGQTGAFGGARQGILESEARRGGLEAISDLYGRGYASAFESGRDQLNRDRQAAQTAAEQFRMLGGQQQQQLTQDIQNLLTTGGLQRNLEQAGLDFDFQQFVENRDWDITNLQPLLAALSTVPYGETQTTTDKSKKSALSTIVGAGMVAAGAFTGNPALIGAGASSLTGTEVPAEAMPTFGKTSRTPTTAGMTLPDKTIKPSRITPPWSTPPILPEQQMAYDPYTGSYVPRDFNPMTLPGAA